MGSSPLSCIDTNLTTKRTLGEKDHQLNCACVIQKYIPLLTTFMQFITFLHPKSSQTVLFNNVLVDDECMWISLMSIVLNVHRGYFFILINFQYFILFLSLKKKLTSRASYYVIRNMYVDYYDML